MRDDEIVECTMIGGGTYHLKATTIRLNNESVDSFIRKAGSLEKAKEVLENNYCWKDAELFLEKKVQALPIYYAFIRQYTKVKRLEKNIEHLHRVIDSLTQNKHEEIKPL